METWYLLYIMENEVPLTKIQNCQMHNTNPKLYLEDNIK